MPLITIDLSALDGLLHRSIHVSGGAVGRSAAGGGRAVQTQMPIVKSGGAVAGSGARGGKTISSAPVDVDGVSDVQAATMLRNAVLAGWTVPSTQTAAFNVADLFGRDPYGRFWNTTGSGNQIVDTKLRMAVHAAYATAADWLSTSAQ